MTPKIENNNSEFIVSLLDTVDGSMLLEVSGTNVFSVIVRDIDAGVDL